MSPQLLDLDSLENLAVKGLLGVRNVPKKFALFAQFLFMFITHGLLFYSVCLHCANLHTPLPFLLYLL